MHPRAAESRTNGAQGHQPLQPADAATVREILGGNSTHAHCPYHDDRTPSLKITDHQGGVSLKCFAGCAFQDVWDAVQGALQEDGLFMRKPSRPERVRLRKRTRDQDSAANARKLWRSATACIGKAHPYLRAKGVDAHGLRLAKDGALLVPMRDGIDGRVQNIQRIYWRDGGLLKGKRRAPGASKKLALSGTTKGLVHGIGDPVETAYICEGYGTAAAVYEATGELAVCAFGAGNLAEAARLISREMPDVRIVIAADNDNAGFKAATKAARAVGASVARPQQRGWDFCDLYRRKGLRAVERQLERAKAAESADRRLGRAGYTAAELMRMELPEPKWIVKGLIPEGVTLLIGKPKIGKSMFCLNLGVAVASDYEALGSLDVEQCGVLYLALEDNPRRLQKRLKMIDWGQRIPVKGRAALHLYTDWPRADEEGLRTWLSEHPEVKLVIVDTFQRFRRLTDGQRSVYADDYEAVAPLNRVAHDFGIAIILVHHQRKAAADDFLDTASSSTGLTGAVDTIAAIYRIRGEADAELKLAGRDVEDTEYAMSWDGEAGRWKLLGNAAEHRMSKERQEIYGLLKNEGPMNATELAKKLKKNYQTCYTLLGRLADEGYVKLTKRGKLYRVVEDGDSDAESVKTVRTVRKRPGRRGSVQDSSYAFDVSDARAKR